MAFGAFAFLFALFKLTLVWIGRVAVAAIGKGELFLEITIQVAGEASDLGVFSNKGIFGFGVVEIKTGQKSFPAAGGVASFAGLLEFAFVRIDVAGGAGRKFHVLVTCGAAGGVGFVAFFAGDFYVQPGQRVSRFGVIEVLGGLPAFDVVAPGAFAPELSFVRIAVARGAARRLAEKGFGKIFHLDEFAIGGKHVYRGVAFFADESGVFAFELVAGEFVIEFLQRRRPADQLEGFPVVLQMAADAIFAGGIVHLYLEVVAVLGGKVLRDFFVAIEALEGGCASAKGMAGIALGSTTQRRVGFRERAGRYLRAG